MINYVISQLNEVILRAKPEESFDKLRMGSIEAFYNELTRWILLPPNGGIRITK